MLYEVITGNSQAILKIRKPKNYRNPILDSSIRKQRTIKESQMISDAKSFGIPTPLVYFVNLSKSSITMQLIPGKPIHDLPNSKIVSFVITSYSIHYTKLYDL